MPLEDINGNIMIKGLYYVVFAGLISIFYDKLRT